jgi:DNA polymerase III delta prime subunit
MSAKTDMRAWKDVEACLPHASRILLYGPPGTGKTTLGFSDDRETFYIPLHEETSVSELVGHFVPVGQRFVWMDGPVLMAWSRGARAVFDEVDKASGSVLSVLLAVLNDPSIARLMLPDPSLATLDDEALAAMIADGEGQRTIVPAEGFQALATMNGEPEDLPEALLDRFDARFRIPRPHPCAIAALPADLQSAAELSSAQDDPERRIGLRRWKAFASLRERVGEAIAARAAFGERAGDTMDALKLARGSDNPPASSTAADSATPNIVASDPNTPKVFPVKTGRPGKPPLASCARHGKMTHMSGMITPSGDLVCVRCDERVAAAGTFRVRELLGRRPDGKSNWITRDA